MKVNLCYWLIASIVVAVAISIAAGHGHHDTDEKHHDDSSSSSSSEEHDDHHDDNHSDDDDDDDRIWNFQIGDNFGAYEFIDPADGALKGFHVDLLRAVCERAHKQCYFIFDNYEHCWQTQGGHEYPGIGLLDEYYDGCLGLYPTAERKNSFNFTLPYTTSLRAVLVFRKGEVPADKNIASKTIGFVSGWAISKNCLARQTAFHGNRIGEYTALFYENHDRLVAALKSKEVDAVLSAEHLMATSKEAFETLAPKFGCTLGGLSVMTRYGSEVINWWNHAYEELHDSGDFRKLCVKAEDAYGSYGDINCLL